MTQETEWGANDAVVGSDWGAEDEVISGGKPKPEKGLLSSLGSEVWQGVKSAGRSVLATGNTAVSDLSDVEQLAKSQKNDAVNDAPEKKALLAEIERRKQSNPDAGWTDAVSDVAGAAWGNKTGTAQMVASQLPNSAVALGGAWAGGKAGAAAGAALGSVVPGVGTAIGGVAGGILGGLTGMFLGNFALETGGKAMDKAGDGFTQQEASDSLTEGAKKAAVITGVDALTFGAGKLATRAFVAPAVRAGARAEAKVLVDAGVDITDGASIAAALANNELRAAAKAAGEAAAKAASSTARRVGNAATGLAMETGGEGVGEYYGEEAATGNGDVYDAALESISSLSQSAFQTAQAMRESGVQGLDPREILKVQLNESAAKPGSVLSRAAVASNPGLKIEPEPVVEPTVQPIDPALAQRLAEVGQGATFDGLPAGEFSPLLNELEDDGATDGNSPGDPVGAGLPPDNAEAGLGARPGAVDRPGVEPGGAPVDGVVPPVGDQPISDAAPVAPIAGDAINKTWTEFHPASGTLNIPRKEMPQIKSEHRGAMTNFLAARGVTGTAETVEASSLKPTQREFSPAKVKQALAFKGSDRPILVSSDGFILDGHHQWLAKAEQEAPVKVTRLSAPIADLLVAMKEFPSAGMTKDAEPFSQPQGKTDVTQAAQAVQTEEKGQEAPAGQLKLVLAPQNVAAEPASASNPGNALVRLRRAQVQRMAQAGFTRLETRGGQTLMVNPARNEAMVVTGGPVAVTLAQQAIATLPKTVDTGALGAQNGRVRTGIPGSDGTAAAGAANASTGAGNSTVPGVGQESGAGLRNAAPDGLGSSGRALQNPQADADAVARLSAASGYQIDLADPASPITQALDKLLDVMAGLTGVRGIAVTDKSKQADDGVAMPGLGRFFVNTDRPQIHVGRTIAHEFKHLTEKNPGLKALYDRMYDLIPAAAKASYFKTYLYPGQNIGQATPAQLDNLKNEMMADFMGQRFNDRAWLETLAKQKPGLFAQFIKEWIPLLDKLITELKGLIKPTKKLAQKDIDTLMKGYVKELEAMKAMAMEVAVAWAQNNPGMAQKSGLVETAADVQFSRRVGPKHSNLTDDYLVPESAIWQDSTTGNLINLPPLTFKGLSRSYPSAPVRIRIGRHGNETNPLTGRPYGQYGLQHRVSNETETSVKKYRVDGDKTDGEQWADLAARDLMVSLMAGRSLYAQQDAAKLGVWSPDPGGQAGLWTILQYATDKETGDKFWDVQTVTPRSAKWVADNHRNNAPLPMSGFTFDGLDAQTSSGLAVRTLNELRAPTPIPPSAETVSIDDQGQVVNPRTAAPVVPVAQKPAVKVLARDANGKIILNKNKVQSSLRDELQAELDAEMAGTTVDIQAKGIMAEEAYPAVAWREAKGSVGTQYVADIPGVKGTERLEMNEDSRSGLWDLGFPGTWVGPAMGERDGYASKKAVQAFAQRQTAAYDLRAKGFDLASTLDKQQQYDLLDAWRTMERVPAEGSVNGSHKYAGIQAVSQSLKDIANDMGITQDYDLTVERDIQDQSTTSFNLVFKHKVSGTEFGARLEQHQEAGKRFLSANTLEMGKGGLGAAFYQLAAEYAARRNLVLRPESALSGINSYRRTEQQLSAALRTGKSNVMVPHPTQRVYGFEDNASRKESHDANLVRLILAGLRNAKELVKDFAKLRYVPETGTFTDAKGKNKEAAVQKLLADVDARAFGLGRSTLARALLTQQVIDGAKAPAAFKEPILYSARDTAALEYQAVIDQYQGTDAWMKAPNGQPTLLTERQWVQVRTPSFAAWFGPWQEYGMGTEKGTVWNDDKGLVSKAIDANGEPLVVYHGTDKGGFMAFSQPGGERRGDLGIFTTPNRDMASSYIRKGREKDLNPFPDYSDLSAMGYEFTPGFAVNGIFYESEEDARAELDGGDVMTPAVRAVTPEGYAIDGPDGDYFASMDDAISGATEAADTGEQSSIYAVFMNIRNPNEDDFEGALWSGSREHLWQVVDSDGETRESDGKIYMEEDEARALAKTLADEDDEYEGADFMQPADDHWNDTDGAVREAIRAKNDGAIIRNVVDDGGGRSSYDDEPSDVFVALKPEMVKSADFNTGEFGLSRDLRYSTRSDDKELQLSLEFKPGFSTGLLGKINTELDSDAQKSYLKAMRDALRSSVPSVQELLGWGKHRYSETVDGGAWKALSGWSIQSTLSLPNGILDEQTRNEINFFLATNGMWTGQEGMAWHLPKFGDKGLGVEFNLGGKKLSAAQFEEVYASVMHEFKNYSIPPIPSKDGLRFLNYTGLPQDEFIRKLVTAIEATSVYDIWSNTHDNQNTGRASSEDSNNDGIGSGLRPGSPDLPGAQGNDDLSAFSQDGIRVFSHDGDLIENDWRKGENGYRELIVKSWEFLKDLPGSRMPKTLEALNQYLATQQENADGVNQFFDDEFDLGKPSLSKEERATGVKERVEFPARTMFKTARTKNAFFKNPDGTLMVLYHGGAPLGNLEQRDGISLFVSTDPNYANRAAKFSAEWGETPESVVYPVTLTVARPFDWRIAGHRDSIAMTAYPDDFPKGKFKAALKAGKFDLLESREFTQAAKAAGYDAVLVRDDSSFSGFLNVGVFNARDVAFAMEPDLGDTLRYSRRDGINPKVLEAIPEVAKLAAYLTPAEKSKLRVDTAQKMIDLHKALPSSDEMAAVAYAGKAKRFWYRNSLSAIAHVFGQDGWRFTGLLAATSPQCSVETNLLNALSTWKNWVAAGRPTSKEEIVAVMGRSVQGNKGEDSVLGAWINNAVSALTAKDFADLVLSGPKVDSFMRNLLGHYYEVTNDAWIANYTLMDQKIFSGSKNKAGTEPGKGPGYLAMNAQTRKAAKKLGWQPAEVQETVWSWAMSMLETMDKQGETRGSKELLADGAMTDELINRTPDFRSLFHLPVYANILEQAGYHDALADLVAPHTVEDHGPMPFEQKKMDKLLHQAGLRLEFLQRQRRTNVQLSWEARPGESTGILPGIHAAPIELQQQYMADIYAAIESSGFYDKTGLSLRNTLFGPGAWQGKVLPGAQSMTRPGIVADNKGGLMVDPESRAKINVAASVLGIVLNQEGVYWHYPIYRQGNEALDNGVEINFGRSLINDEMAQLYGAIITRAGRTDWAPANTPTGVRVLNFSETANKSFHKVIQSALKQFERKFDGDASAVTFSSDGDALENNWKESINGQDYLARISQAGRSDLLGWIVDVLQPAVDQVNRRYSTEHNWGAPTRGDIQRSAREGGPSHRRRPSDAATVRQAIHFGQRAGLSQLSGLSNGTGIRGAEDQRLKEATDPRIKRRVYFYSPVTGGIPQPEAGLGGNVYQADLDNLYDPSTATRPLSGSGNTFESSVLDAGYDGYLDPTSGVIVMLGQDVPVKQIGSLSDFKLIPRVAKQVTPKTLTTVSGDEFVRKPQGVEMVQLAAPAKRKKIHESAPSFAMEYGYFRVKQSEAAAADEAIAEFSPTFRFGEAAPVVVKPTASGIIFRARDTGRILLAQRGDRVASPGTWAGFGGAIDANETPEQAARREALEEAGFAGDVRLTPVYLHKDGGLVYQNYIADVATEFTPKLNPENKASRWVDAGALPDNLHPGMQALFKDANARSALGLGGVKPGALAASSSLPNDKMSVNKTVEQRVANLRELLACLA